MTEQIAEQIRQAIRDSGKPLSAIATAAGVAYSRLHEFMAGNDIKLSNAQKLCDHFKLRIKMPSKRK